MPALAFACDLRNKLLVTFQGFVVKQILPRKQGQSDERAEEQKQRYEATLAIEADMLLRLQLANFPRMLPIVATPKIDGSMAIVMEHGGGL